MGIINSEVEGPLESFVSQVRSKAMTSDPTHLPRELSPREQRFLDRLSRKYADEKAWTYLRSYVIAGLVLLILFAASKWIPYGFLALLLVEAGGLWMFHQYKRFARFKSRLLVRLWQDRRAANLAGGSAADSAAADESPAARP
jgi:hypothetical protein